MIALQEGMTSSHEGGGPTGSVGSNIRVLQILTLLALLVLTCSSGFLGPDRASGEWKSIIFEENVDLSYNPTEPLNMQPVNVTIHSKDQQIINAANLNIHRTDPSGEVVTGGWAMQRVNTTAMRYTIPGYKGGTEVVFDVEAWDNQNNRIQSQEYHYSVIANGSWAHDSFEENLDLEMEPEEPTSSDTVDILIRSREPDVQVKEANLYLLVEFPGVTPQSGSLPFEHINRTVLSVEVNAYPGGTNVTYWIEAFDEYGTKMRSPDHTYSIPKPPPTGPRYNVTLFVVVQDETKGGYADQASVTFKNSTWRQQTKTINGLAWTTYGVNRGTYSIEVEYLNETKTKEVVVPNADNEYTAYFIMNEKTLKVGYPTEDFPQIWVTFSMLGCLLAGMAIYRYQGTLKDLEKEILKGKEDEDELEPTLKERFKEWAWGSEIARADTTRVLAFFGLGIAGTTWIPFYPWWMVLFVALITAVIAYRYPYLSLLVLSIFVIGAAGYQTAEFGLLYLVFSLIVLTTALFDWRFGYLVMLTIFLSRLGIAFIVPAAATLMFSLFMGMVVAVASGLFLSFLVNTANIEALSFFVGTSHEYSFVTFSRPVVIDLIPTHFTDAIAGISYADLEAMGLILHEGFNSMVPVLEIIVWCLLTYMVYKLVRPEMDPPLKVKEWAPRTLLPGLVLGLAGSASMFYFGHIELDMGSVHLLLALLGAMGAFIVVPPLFLLARRLFPEIFSEEAKGEMIGTTISDMTSFRKTNFDSIGGLEEVKEELKGAMIVPLLKPDLAKKYRVEPSKGILLFGPPGCGKTLLMRALATELNVEMLGIKCSDLMSKWYGESENLVNSMFQEAKKRKPCILFLDEIDSITKRRDFYSTDDVTPRILSIMLTELDGMDEASGVIVVGSTNRPELVDPALMRPGRFDKIIYIPPPDRPARREIFKIHMEGRPVDDDIDLDELAERTTRYSGADIANLAQEAASVAMKRAMVGEEGEKGKEGKKVKHEITKADLLSLLDFIQPSISPDMEEEYEKLKEEFQRKRFKTSGEGRREKEKPEQVEKTKGARKAGARGSKKPERARGAKGAKVSPGADEKAEKLEEGPGGADVEEEGPGEADVVEEGPGGADVVEEGPGEADREGEEEPSSEPELEMEFECSNCGAPLADDVTTCPRCGRAIESEEKWKEEEQMERDKALEETLRKLRGD